jgi:hypothetical protein
MVIFASQLLRNIAQLISETTKTTKTRKTTKIGISATP